MAQKKKLFTSLVLPFTAWIVLAACAAPSAPARFEVVSLDVQPAEITVGQPVGVSARVANTGGNAGDYYAALTVDGEKTNTKYINLEPGSVQPVAFSLTLNKPGVYRLGVGNKTATLTVKSRLVASKVEMVHDSVPVKDYLSLVKPCTGYLVSFDAPTDPFIINQVRVYGLVYSSSGYNIGDSDLQIWDGARKVLFSMPFPVKQFPLVTRLGDNTGASGDWADIEIPGVEVKGDFYIHIYTGPPAGQGFKMGATSAVVNTHSDATIRSAGGTDSVAAWPYAAIQWYGDKNRVNWMVRVVGNAMRPQE